MTDHCFCFYCVGLFRFRKYVLYAVQLYTYVHVRYDRIGEVLDLFDVNSYLRLLIF